MARLVFPDEGSRLVYRTSGASLLASAGLSAVFYTNAAATVLADIRVHDGTTTPGAAHSGSSVSIDAYSRLPLFWGPDGVDTLYVVVSGGPATPVYARTDDRLDANTTTIATLPTTYARIARSPFPPFTPRLPIVLTSDPPTITYTDHTTASPLTTSIPPTDSRLTFRGFVLGTRTITGNPTWINVANGYLGSTDYAVGTEFGTYPPYDIEFDFYGPSCVLHTIGLQATYNWQVYVDGLPVSTTPIAMDPLRTGVSFGQFAKMTWATSRMRRVRIRVPSNLGLIGIRTTANDSVSAVTKSAPTCFVLGDSWVAGTGATDPITAFPAVLGLLTGWDVFHAGQGGTGYVNQSTGANSEFGSTARLNPVIAAQPDFLIVAGSSNDDTLAAGPAATALYAAAKAGCPDTRIIVLGPQNTSSTVSAARETVRAAVIAAATASPNVALVIDPITGTWITGTGTVSAPGTAGNASVFSGGATGSDGAHLNQDGYEYWARRVHGALAAAGFVTA